MLKVPTPRTAIITGSGIAESFAPYPIIESIPYAQIRGMPVSDVSGHSNELRVVDVSGMPVLVFLGRSHLYEGTTSVDACAAVALCARIGVKRVLLTNASGGVHPMLKIGDVVLCTDLLDISMKRFASTRNKIRVIDPDWTSAIAVDSLKNGVSVKNGTYVQVLGPSYETRAEIRMLRTMGADVVGMSTGLEAIKAAELGVSVAIASVVTNTLSDTTPHELSHSEVLAAGRSSIQRLQTIFHSAIFAT